MFPYQQNLVDIPELFHSVEFKGPFPKCLLCSQPLLDNDTVEPSSEIDLTHGDNNCNGQSSSEINAPSDDLHSAQIPNDSNDLQQEPIDPWKENPLSPNSQNDNQVIYMVEKVYRGSEAIMEMAICLPCLMQMQDEISDESKAIIQNQFHSQIDWEARLEWSLSQAAENKLDPQRWLESCIFTGDSRSNLYSFQACGMFYGNQLMLNQLPYILSGKAIEKISGLLSTKTKDHMQDFIDTQFGMPPEFCNPESPIPMLF